MLTAKGYHPECGISRAVTYNRAAAAGDVELRRALAIRRIIAEQLTLRRLGVSIVDNATDQAVA